VVQIWPGLIVCTQVTVCPGHTWTTLYLNILRKYTINYTALNGNSFKKLKEVCYKKTEQFWHILLVQFLLVLTPKRWKKEAYSGEHISTKKKIYIARRSIYFIRRCRRKRMSYEWKGKKNEERRLILSLLVFQGALLLYLPANDFQSSSHHHFLFPCVIYRY
jgi:hypothetical protein